MEQKIPSYIKATYILSVIIALSVILYYGQSIIVPLIGSLLIAILLNPVVNTLTKIRINRVIGISIILIIFTTIFILIILLLTCQVSQGC
jgi:AI-2 transport protein TqsA